MRAVYSTSRPQDAASSSCHTQSRRSNAGASSAARSLACAQRPAAQSFNLQLLGPNVRGLPLRASQGQAAGPAAGSQQQAKWAPPSGILKISPELLAAGGLDPARDGPQAKAAFDGHLGSLFLPVNLDFPGLRVLNIDPPIIAVQGLLSPEECDALTTAAAQSGLLKPSAVGSYAAPDAKQQQQQQPGAQQAPPPKEIRTSHTLAATSEVLKTQPALAAAWSPLLNRARELLPGPLPAPNSAASFSRPSAPGQFAFELPQVARYQPGQHFLTHEDGFPTEVALVKGYQRRATLLVYLNDCAQGGATHFDIVNVSVQPRKGSALLFFPAFKNGAPDRRTLHTAQDAVDEKWVTQLWLSVGLARPPQPGGLPSFVRGVKGAPQPNEPKARKRGVPPQRINTKI